ncbi:MAG: hypothetical protein CSA74_11360 [Rhodobacterales bacterium]|nr:MAG: hypothetical protein CSA74_11360 [Rhodobacterales bacterium]
MREGKLRGDVAAMMPDRRTRLKIWAIRSAIVMVAAGLFVRAGVAPWFFWAALGYVGLTLVLAFALTRPGSGGPG